jgi:hypothetical protein
VGRPKRGLAALEMGCRDFKARAPVNGVFHPELLIIAQQACNRTAGGGMGGLS